MGSGIRWRLSSVDVARLVAGAGLGEGRAWGLRQVVNAQIGTTSNPDALVEQLQHTICRLERRVLNLFEQARSQSHLADVEFVLQNGQTVVCGHRGMLCAVSPVFEAMFTSGMAEEIEGRVMVPPGVSATSFRGFLEFVCLG